jgi:hypothetical protein
LVKSANLPILPAAWTTLYVLSQLSKKEFTQALEWGFVKADMTLAAAERLKTLDQKIDNLHPKATRRSGAQVCNVIKFEKPDDAVELVTGVLVECEQISVEAHATTILGYLQKAHDHFEGCDDDQEQAALVDGIIKHAEFEATIDAIDRVLALFKQAADDRPKLNLVVNNDAPSPPHDG